MSVSAKPINFKFTCSVIFTDKRFNYSLLLIAICGKVSIDIETVRKK